MHIYYIPAHYYILRHIYTYNIFMSVLLNSGKRAIDNLGE